MLHEMRSLVLLIVLSAQTHSMTISIAFSTQPISEVLSTKTLSCAVHVCTYVTTDEKLNENQLSAEATNQDCFIIFGLE